MLGGEHGVPLIDSGVLVASIWKKVWTYFVADLKSTISMFPEAIDVVGVLMMMSIQRRVELTWD